jgi:probable HAF family extracellular repeat protein
MKAELLSAVTAVALFGFIDPAFADTYTFATLDDPSATGNTFARGINNRGQIVGSYADDSGYHGFLYDHDCAGRRA